MQQLLEGYVCFLKLNVQAITDQFASALVNLMKGTYLSYHDGYWNVVNKFLIAHLSSCYHRRPIGPSSQGNNLLLLILRCTTRLIN